jgi:hypothetical protein
MAACLPAMPAVGSAPAFGAWKLKRDAERAGQLAAIDGEAMIALHADSGGAAVSAVRRRATTVSVASAGHDRR